MSTVDVLLGLQYGDEGKGKVSDVLALRYDIVARFQGGPNAGHTLEFNKEGYVLHTIPSGVFRKDLINVIGNGVVIDPITFKKEIEMVLAVDSDCLSRIIVSNKAKIIVPSGRFVDACNEWSKGGKKIGSTLKGIGPTYQDDLGRVGLRIRDIFCSDFREKYFDLLQRHIQYIQSYSFPLHSHKIDNLTFKELEKQFLEAIDFIRMYVSIEDTEYFLNQQLDEGQKILAEGAQGTLLDINFGTYPMVTSSNTISGAVCTGLGIAPSRIGEVYGVFKAYITRVGNGPLPTELYHEGNPKFQDPDGKLMAECGHEYGATTGRPRRCGWLDLPALKYACMLNGVNKLVMTKADVIQVQNGFDKIKIAVEYKLKDGTITNKFYSDKLDQIEDVIYQEFDSWLSIDVEAWKDLPDQFIKFVDYIEECTGIPVCMVSNGPDRDQVIYHTL
ncbi:MAG TPA: adenylosuccinate synthase [Candidatus Absconditabacterales bacterium]|nr:adenylosuccinate synthase [Candidatus Absconditabacterales bacterium]